MSPSCEAERIAGQIAAWLESSDWSSFRRYGLHQLHDGLGERVAKAIRAGAWCPAWRDDYAQPHTGGGDQKGLGAVASGSGGIDQGGSDLRSPIPQDRHEQQPAVSAMAAALAALADARVEYHHDPDGSAMDLVEAIDFFLAAMSVEITPRLLEVRR